MCTDLLPVMSSNGGSVDTPILCAVISLFPSTLPSRVWLTLFTSCNFNTLKWYLLQLLTVIMWHANPKHAIMLNVRRYLDTPTRLFFFKLDHIFWFNWSEKMHLRTFLLVLILVKKCETDAAKCLMRNALKTGLPPRCQHDLAKGRRFIGIYVYLLVSGCLVGGVFQQTAAEVGA